LGEFLVQKNATKRGKQKCHRVTQVGERPWRSSSQLTLIETFWRELENTVTVNGGKPTTAFPPRCRIVTSQ